MNDDEIKVEEKIILNLSVNGIADNFADGGSNQQSEFINRLSKSLKNNCGSKVGIQLCAIADLLDEDGVSFIKDIHEFISNKTLIP